MPLDDSGAVTKQISRSPDNKSDGFRDAMNDRLAVLQTTNYLAVESTTSLAEAIERLKTVDSGCAIVCEAGLPVGRFTQHDVLVRVVCESVDFNTPVSMFMSKGVESVEPLRGNSSMADAVRAMNETDCWEIPVTENGKLTGSISVFDILSYIAESYPKEIVNLPPSASDSSAQAPTDVRSQVMDRREGG